MTACTPPQGHVLGCDDCDDGNRGRNPSAPEVCDGVDNNCNGRIDDGLPNIDCCRDEDGDGYSNPGMRTSGCRACVNGWRPCGGSPDCCDSDNRTFPTARCEYQDRPNRCGSFDYNCDGRAQMRFSRIVSTTEPVDCSMSGGWFGTSVPACGTSGRSADCGASDDGRCMCTAGVSMVQPCC